jgi:hypothetical protein
LDDRLDDYAQATTLMSEEPGSRMPPLAIVDYAAIESGVPAPPYVLSIVGPDRLSNWDGTDQNNYRENARAGRMRSLLILIVTIPGWQNPSPHRHSTPHFP